MPKGYWIPHLDVSNPDGFQAYRSKADAWHEHNGSMLLARGGRCERVDGKMRSRNVLRQFGSFDEALAAYRSPEYSAARPLRAPYAQCDFLIVEGFEGPQPGRIGTPPAAAARKGYWIAHVDITDPEGYKAYQVATGCRSVNSADAFWCAAGVTRWSRVSSARVLRCWSFRAMRRRSRATVRPVTKPQRHYDWARPRLI